MQMSFVEHCRDRLATFYGMGCCGEAQVWSEPSMVQAGVFEFAETPDFLRAGGLPALLRYWMVPRVLVLPPGVDLSGSGDSVVPVGC